MTHSKTKFQVLKSELPPTLRLAMPVALTQLGQMLMALVDTFMVGKLGAAAVGGVSIGNAVFYAVAIFGMGILLGLDYLVSHAYGRKALDECHHWLVQSVYVTFIISIPLFIILFIITFYLDSFGIDPQVVKEAQPFLQILILNLLPFLLFSAFRQYLQAMNDPSMITVIMILANLANAFLNWIFVFGNWGAPQLETAGSALATTITRTLMLVLLIAYTLWQDRRKNLGLINTSWKPKFLNIKKLISLGLPAAFQLLFEVAVFSLATTLTGRLGAIPLAAHTIVLNIASFTFMVPFGISSAAAVRVGQAIGKGNHDEARHAGWTSIFLAGSFMTLSAIFLYVFRDFLIGLFISDEQVIKSAIEILILAALFQVSDGLQTVGTGALRGLSDTQSAMYANLVGHWLIGLPIGYYLCFTKGFAITGLWTGLTLGLTLVAIAVTWQWARLSKTVIKLQKT
ncbi:MAG: MATE family efflux transporter [Oligoflexia bacterium]|nr:MATE family efflux transporter [Oligoflexia bacterium]